MATPTPTTQPSNVSTADTPERPQNVFTEEPAIAEARASEAASGNQPGQNSDDSASSPDKSKRKPHRDRPAERRISKLTKKLDISQATNAELLERIEALETNAPAPKKAPEPQFRDFKTPQEYAHALTAWEKESKPAPKQTPKPGTPAKPTASTAQAEALKQFAKDGNKRLGDTFKVAFKDNDLAINKVMGEFLLDSDLGPEVMVYLHEHPDEARQIWFDDLDAANERLDAIEAELDEPTTATDDAGGNKPTRGKDGKFVKAEPDPEPKTRTTKSSAPPAPGDSERGEIVPDTNLEKAGMEDYAATRRKQLRDQGQRY